MPPEALAALAAALFASSHVAARRGVQRTSVPSGLLISLSTGALTVGAVTLASGPARPAASTIAVFAAAGVLAPGVARAGAIIGVQRLGASVAVPIQTSVYPLMAVAGAALVLGEDLGALRVAGVAAIVGGLWLLSRRRAEPTAPDVDPIAADEPPSPVRRRLRPALAIPVLTGLAYAGADLFRSSALDEQVEPLVGAFIGLLVAVGGWSAAITALPPLRTRLRAGRSAPWFAASGAMAACAIMMQFQALADGDVSVVSPIVACQPLVVLLLARLVLSDIEQLRRTTVAGGIATVTGAVLVSL